MAIVPIVHATIIGPASMKAAAMENFQEKGYLHIISKAADAGWSLKRHSSKAMEAYRFLKSCPVKRRQVLEESPFEQHKIVEQCLAIREKCLVLQEERDHLQQHLSNLEPWGNFSLPPLAATRGYRFWFYVVPLYHLPELQKISYPWECVYKDNRGGYIVVISSSEPKGMPVPRTHTGSKSLAAVRKRLDEIEAELDDLHWWRRSLTRWLTIFARRLATVEDQAHLNKTLKQLYDDGDLFYFEAWLPEPRVGDLHEYTGKEGLFLQIRRPRPNETPPTLLENPPAWSGGETLVKFYSTPAYDMWDPSRPLLLSFVLFFAMIVSDAGYGLVLCLAWLFSHKKLFRASPGLCRLLGLLTAATIVYGILVGSYFGLAPEAGTLLDRLQLLDLSNKEQMMFLAICIGVGHLIIANSFNFIFAERSSLYLRPLGWAIILAGGFSWWLGAFAQPGTQLLINGGQTLLLTGTLCVLFFSSSRPLHGWKNLGLRLLDGLLALTGFSKIFGDVLSYLRLFALGLASTQLAMTFNNLAGEAAANISGLGTLAAICILSVGHGLNLLLAVMGGLIHGLRLNYIEFFNWGLSHEGYPFMPLRKRRISLWNQL